MTLALGMLGCCHLVTASGLRGVRPAARAMLITAGVASLGVAAFPQPAHGSSATHLTFATLSIGTLALWPALVGSRRRSGSPVLGVGAGLGATVTLAVLVAWLLIETGAGSRVGVAERVVTSAETVWPLVVVVAARTQAAKIRA
jgi:hypothetical membrane protein